MSMAFGWHGRNHQDQSAYNDQTGGYFKPTTDAPPTPVVKTVDHPPTPPRPSLQQLASVQARPAPGAHHALETMARIVLIVAIDVTASMRHWLAEIFRRAPLLHADACKYFETDDLEILFIAYGDARTDNRPIQVGRFGRGPELDLDLASFDQQQSGGGQGSESPELVAYYLLKQVKMPNAQQAYTFFLTDEGPCLTVDRTQVQDQLGLTLDTRVEDTHKLLNQLRRRMSVFTILCETHSYDPPMVNRIRDTWLRLLGEEHLLPLNDARRVVDVMLGVFASLTHQTDRFQQDFLARQQGSRYAQVNLQTVMHSVALVGGTPALPKLPASPGTRPLLPAHLPSKKIP